MSDKLLDFGEMSGSPKSVIAPKHRKLSTSYSEIEKYLILGNCETAINEEILNKFQVKRIVTLREMGIKENKKLKGIQYFHVCINDTQNDDILTHFPKCHKIIEDGQRNEETVLVHCRLGVSRSATIVVSYIMAKYGLHWDTAIKMVKKKRNEIRPNSNFIYQLKLWDEMEFTFNAFNPSFRLFLLKRWLFVMKKKIISNSLDADSTILENFFSILSVSPNVEGKTYNCRKCKTILFRDINVVEDLVQNKEERYQCPYVITEPKEWMLPSVCKNATGSIGCPNCSYTVGDYNWQNPLCLCTLHSKFNAYQAFRFVSSSLICIEIK